MFDQIKDFKCEIRRLEEYIENLEQRNKELRERIKLLESGTRCDGKWCDHCVHYGGSEYEWSNGVIQAIRPVCLKDVPCPDFKRRGSPRPGKQEGGPTPR